MNPKRLIGTTATSIKRFDNDNQVVLDALRQLAGTI
jgi:hypothetical protein